MTIQEFIKSSGMTHKQLSERFGIPKRTIEDWSRGVRKCPEYVVNMMEEILMKEKTSMYKEFLVLDGTIENVEELNKAVEAETGCTEFFDTESEEWRGWVEYRDGKTIILSEEA